jgi:haloalkane dehalogenase
MVTGLGARNPEMIDGLVLGNTSVLAPRRPRGTAFHRFSQTPVVSDLVFRGLSFPQNVMSRAQGDRSSISGEVARAYRWPLRRLKDRAGPLALARMVPNSPEHPSMGPLRAGEAFTRGLGAPIELVWGDSDPILGKMARRHVEALPEASITHTPAGHFLQEEVPEEFVAAVLRIGEKL